MTSTGVEQTLILLIVDDEPLARRGLRDLVARLPGAFTMLEAGSGSEAIRLILERRPDLVLLDVQMPRMDGFGVIEAVGASQMPPVIFVTAHDEHALRAFEVHAVDYLLKPVDPERLRDALDRARRALATDQVSALQAAAAAALSMVRHRAEAGPPATASGRIAIREGERILFVRHDEIDWIEAGGNYVQLHLKGGRIHRYRATMDEMEIRLGPDFVRIRRSTLVRTAAIRYCEPWGKGSFVLVLYDETKLTSSRYFRGRLKPLLGE